eukprot:GHRR01010240.1.p3 GENE.GHRR01010240.1~~GHRR01010240.1.p3  ORF type:complete len:116 (+),score=15.99 GHRR01010240.1:1778-2125(+)
MIPVLAAWPGASCNTGAQSIQLHICRRCHQYYEHDGINWTGTVLHVQHCSACMYHLQQQCNKLVLWHNVRNMQCQREMPAQSASSILASHCTYIIVTRHEHKAAGFIHSLLGLTS